MYILWFLFIGLSDCAFYHTYSGKQISQASYSEYQTKNLVPFCALEIKECNRKERRRMDYSCNNLHKPSRGSQMTPYRRLLLPVFDPMYRPRVSLTGAPLPNARRLRTSIVSDGRIPSHHYTHMVSNAGVAITGDVSSVHDTANYVVFTQTCCAPGGDADPRCIPIYVPPDDVHLRRSSIRCLNLTRAITFQDLGCVDRSLPPERINTSPPLLDISFLYGNDEKSGRRGREGTGGRLRSEVYNGAEWPPSGSVVCRLNQPPNETRCHDMPVPGVNSVIGTNLLSMWLLRSHNTLARQIETLNPCWDDEQIYFEAREINIAMLNQIWYYELWPGLLGYDFLLKNDVIFETKGHVDDYNPKLEPGVSIEFILSTRWFHTMQEGRIKLYDRTGVLLREMAIVELTLRTGVLPNNKTLEGLTQGFFRQPAGASDYIIDPDIGERILGPLQTASDVMSSDIMKNRDQGLPPYNRYRQLCGLETAADFDDLLHWMPEDKVDALRLIYESVEDMDLLVGISSEYQTVGSVGPTLACIIVEQLKHWRRSDRFWYENRRHPGAFSKEQLHEIRKMSLARLICDHGDEVDSIQRYAFLVPGPGNEIVDCKIHPKLALDPWKDDVCIGKNTENESGIVYDKIKSILATNWFSI